MFHFHIANRHENGWQKSLFNGLQKSLFSVKIKAISHIFQYVKTILPANLGNFSKAIFKSSGHFNCYICLKTIPE